MCGRVYVKWTPPIQDFCERNNIDTSIIQPDLDLRNMPPSSQLPVIVPTDIGLRTTLMRWQLIPSWAKEDSGFNRHPSNARIETILTNGMFRNAVKYRRGIVPVAAFIEWQRVDNAKMPYFIDAGDQPLLMAGIWENWRDQIWSFAVVTQEANDSFSWLHDRMPLSLTEEQAMAWVNPANNAEALVHELHGHSLTLYPKAVSPVINNAGNKMAIKP